MAVRFGWKLDKVDTIACFLEYALLHLFTHGLQIYALITWLMNLEIYGTFKRMIPNSFGWRKLFPVQMIETVPCLYIGFLSIQVENLLCGGELVIMMTLLVGCMRNFFCWAFLLLILVLDLLFDVVVGIRTRYQRLLSHLLPFQLFCPSIYWCYTRFFSCRGRGNRCPILWTDNAFGKVAFLVVLKFGKVQIHHR